MVFDEFCINAKIVGLRLSQIDPTVLTLVCNVEGKLVRWDQVVLGKSIYKELLSLRSRIIEKIERLVASHAKNSIGRLFQIFLSNDVEELEVLHTCAECQANFVSVGFTEES